jgi:hypothetical protein
MLFHPLTPSVLLRDSLVIGLTDGLTDSRCRRMGTAKIHQEKEITNHDDEA